MPLDDVKEKLWSAVRVLAVADARIQVRLAVAAEHLVRVQADDVPAPIRDELNSIVNDLTSQTPLANEGFIQATTSRLTPEEGMSVAGRILKLYNVVCLGFTSTAPETPSPRG